jgi:hypothetical protein
MWAERHEMLEQCITQLVKELGLGTPVFEKDGSCQLEISSYPVKIVKQESGAYLSALVAPPPPKEMEEYLLKLMQANFLGQGTGGAVLGMTEDESFLTLSLNLPYEINYRAFKDTIEEFINYLEYWKTETAKYVAEVRTR